ncbi:MAG: hypothetical protein AB7I27_19175 [Bacteriovoracaceae bacterium]
MFELIVLGLICIVGAVGYLSCWYYFIKAITGQLKTSVGVVGLIFGVGIPVIGIPMGLWFLFTTPSQKQIEEALNEVFNPDKPEGVVDFIDKWANSSVITSNSAWLKNNWHIMNDAQKVVWVKDRFDLLKEKLPHANSAPEFLNSIQEADKNFTRNQKKVS